MTLATTRARVSTVLESVAGIGSGAGKVHNRIRDDLDRADAESDLMGSAGINCWEHEVRPSVEHQGASGLTRSVATVRIVAHYKAADATDSLGTFYALLEAVALALANPISGFPQMGEAGVRLAEAPSTPIKLRTDQSALRGVLEFELWDLSTT